MTRFWTDSLVGGGSRSANGIIANHLPGRRSPHRVSQCKVPRPVDSSKAGFQADMGLGKQETGDTRPRLSGGRTVLYPCRQASLISHTSWSDMKSRT